MALGAFDSPDGLWTCGQWPGLGTDRTGFRSNEHAHADEGICWLGQKLAECDRLALRRLTVTLHPAQNIAFGAATGLSPWAERSHL